MLAQEYTINPDEAEYPELMDRLISNWTPSIQMGPTGLTLFDPTGNKKGTLTNMAADSDWVTSEGRWALEFVFASANFVNVGTTNNFPGMAAGEFSISSWWYGNSSTTGYQYGDYDAGGTSNNIAIRHDAAGGLSLIWGGLVAFSAPGVVSSTSKWRHMNVGRIGSASAWTAYIVLDGIEYTSATTVNPIGTNLAVSIGKPGAFSGLYFTGLIDDVKFYSRPTNKIAALDYSLGRGGWAARKQIPWNYMSTSLLNAAAYRMMLIQHMGQVA